jgi:hypothetical protein
VSTEQNTSTMEKSRNKVTYQRGASEAVYGLGTIGAAVYYIGHATTIWMGVVGFLKAIVWPAFLIFEALKYLNM